jgi:hypothetical protein
VQAVSNLSDDLQFGQTTFKELLEIVSDLKIRSGHPADARPGFPKSEVGNGIGLWLLVIHELR